jgi:hypothetical protein
LESGRPRREGRTYRKRGNGGLAAVDCYAGYSKAFKGGGMEQGSCGTLRSDLGSEALTSVLNARGFKLGPTIGEGSYSKVTTTIKSSYLHYNVSKYLSSVGR